MSDDATDIASVSPELSSRDHTDASVSDTAVRLKLIREAFGFSQRELAKRAGVTNSSISMIEQAQVSPSVQSLARILAAFPMGLADFFSFELSGEPFPTLVAGTDIPSLTNASQQLDARIDHLSTGQSTVFGVSAVDCCGVILSGSVQLTLMGRNQLLGQGDSFYIPSNQLYRLINLSGLDASLFRCSLFVRKG